MARLDEEVERKFAGRLNAAIRVWVDVLTDRKRRKDDDDSVIRRHVRDEKRLNVEPILIKNHVLYVSPSVESR